jgi:hypothetical protein
MSMIKISLFLLLLIAPFTAFCQDETIPVVIDGDEISYLQEEGKVIARGNVEIKYKDVQLFCQEANYDASTNIAHIKGEVKIVRDGTVLYGRDVAYDFNTFNAEMLNMRIEDPPIYGQALKTEKKGKDQYILEEGYVTTCDLEEPHYRLVAKRVTVYPGEKVVARNMVLKVGKVPVFYIPYFSQSLKDKSFPVELVPGKNGDWGYYLLSRWRYNLNEENRGKIHFDWYEKRGLGVGLTHKVETKDYGKALINYYHIEDDLYALENRSELFGKYPYRKNMPSKYLEDDRYKAQIAYSWDPTPDLSVRSEFHKFSDEYFMKDFFYREYDREPEPKSYNLVKYSLPQSSLSLFTQKRANHFFTETEYLPQLEYNSFEQQVGSTKMYFASDSKLGNLEYVEANTGMNHEAFRFYSQNTLNYVDNIAWLNINPYISAHTAFYSRNRLDIDDIWRFAPEFGVNLNTKVSQTFYPYWYLFGEEIDETRHIITPEINFSYIHEPTVSNNNLFPLDSMGNMMMFDEADDLQRREAITFALRNKLQARNAERTWDFLYFSPSVEYVIDEEGSSGSHFDNVKADLEIYPRKGISLNADTIYDLSSKHLDEINTDINFNGMGFYVENGEVVEKEKYSVALGHRYKYGDKNQGTLGFNYQLTPKLQFRNYLRYRYDSGSVEEQQYALRTDLHCWWMDIGLDIDKQRLGANDYTFWVIFRLKAFPDVHVGFDHTYEGARESY